MRNGTVHFQNSTLAKRVHYQGRDFCLKGFSVLVAGHSDSYRKTSVKQTMDQLSRELNANPQNNFVDQSDQLHRGERGRLLGDITRMGNNDFVMETARGFLLDHMDLLADHDPASGQKQLDSAVMQNVYDLYIQQNGGDDCVGVVSRSSFDRLLSQLLKENNFKIRDRKTVSKCEICESHLKRK